MRALEHFLAERVGLCHVREILSFLENSFVRTWVRTITLPTYIHQLYRELLMGYHNRYT